MAIVKVLPCHIRLVRTETILFSNFFSSKAVSYCSISPLKWVTQPKAVSFDKDNDQAVGFNTNVMLLINVLLDDSVVIIINFNQPSIE